MRNIPSVKITDVNHFSAFDIIKFKKIIFNDYIEVSKSFVSLKETKLINSILDKLINEKK